MQDNMNSISTSRHLLELTDEYNFALVSSVLQDSVLENSQIINDNRFKVYISTIRSKFTTDSEVKIADSLSLAYSEYVKIINEAPAVMKLSKQERTEWYFRELSPAYKNLKYFKKKLSTITQQALIDNSKDLQDGFYRSIMPGIIAVAAGLLLVLLFNYFINLYFIAPVIMIMNGIKKYKAYKKSYNIQFDNDDELQDLNNDVHSLIEENKKLKQKLQL
jgi:methyl-accepting chemotaxis protein